MILRVLEVEKHDECGVFGVRSPGDPVIAMTYGGLLDLQHRGQQGAGVAFLVKDRNSSWLQAVSGEGLVTQALSELAPDIHGRSTMDSAMQSPVAVGHVRYTTAGGSEGLQPRMSSKLAFSKNGHIEDIQHIADRYGVDCGDAVSDSDTKFRILLELTERYGDIQPALDELLPNIQGAYCVVITDGDRLIGYRDPRGFHPLVLGKIRQQEGYVLASETCALESSNADYVREVEPGEIVTIDDSGVHSRRFAPAAPKYCGYEYYYTAREESIVEGAPVYEVRKILGRYLAHKYPIDADLVIAVPNTGVPAAEGYAEASGLPYRRGLFKGQYVQRTFILDGHQQQNALSRKFRPNSIEIAGKRLIVLDDSLIKGKTQGALRKMLKEEGGAAEVHVMLTAPPYAYGCYQGMATGDESQLAARHFTIDEICEQNQLDSLHFASEIDLVRAVNEARKLTGNPALPADSFCTACSTGEYPLTGPTFDRLNARNRLARTVIDLGMPSLSPVR